MVKAALEAGLVAALVILASGGGSAGLHELATWVRVHAASRWSLELGRLARVLLDRNHLHLLGAGLALDALLTAVEGWGLWRGRRWGPWLVVVATLVPLPWEAWEIARRGSPLRIALLVVNLAAAAYLARRATGGGARGPSPGRASGAGGVPRLSSRPGDEDPARRG